MEKKFEVPELIIVAFEEEDIITFSGDKPGEEENDID